MRGFRRAVRRSRGLDEVVKGVRGGGGIGRMILTTSGTCARDVVCTLYNLFDAVQCCIW